jgi:WD40 repeat protein
VAFNTDGTRLVTGSWDGTARIWDVSGYREQVLALKNIDDLLAFASARVQRQLSEEEKRQYLHEVNG